MRRPASTGHHRGRSRSCKAGALRKHRELDAVDPAAGGELDHVDAPLARPAPEDLRRVGLGPPGDLALGRVGVGAWRSRTLAVRPAGAPMPRLSAEGVSSGPWTRHGVAAAAVADVVESAGGRRGWSSRPPSRCPGRRVDAAPACGLQASASRPARPRTTTAILDRPPPVALAGARPAARSPRAPRRARGRGRGRRGGASPPTGDGPARAVAGRGEVRRHLHRDDLATGDQPGGPAEGGGASTTSSPRRAASRWRRPSRRATSPTSTS